MIRTPQSALADSRGAHDWIANLADLAEPELVLLEIPAQLFGPGWDEVLVELSRLPHFLVAWVGEERFGDSWLLANACDVVLAAPGTLVGNSRSQAHPAEEDPAVSGVVATTADLERRLGELTRAARRPATSILARLLRHAEVLAVEEALLRESLAYATLQGGSEFATWLDSRSAS